MKIMELTDEEFQKKIGCTREEFAQTYEEARQLILKNDKEGLVNLLTRKRKERAMRTI